MSDCVTLAFRRGMLEHILALRPKIALYTKIAQLNEKTARYFPDAEVRGDGYSPGGVPLSGGKITEVKDGLVVSFENAVWPNATISARWALIYLADDAGRAVRVIDFGKDIVSTNGPFAVKLPSAADGGVVTV